MDPYGAIRRGDTTQKQIALVFTGDEFADGGKTIREALKKNNVLASFFFTGNFYGNPRFRILINHLKYDGHYLGAHSDKHLLYADWEKPDSLLVSKKEFKIDLHHNYVRMEAFGIEKEEALYFLPPYEWYNAEIVKWTREEGLRLINFSPGTYTTADYTYPEMGERYRSTARIYQSVMELESDDPAGLNGFILLIHIGTDSRRKDKFYHRLDELITELKSKGYRFMTIPDLLHVEVKK